MSHDIILVSIPAVCTIVVGLIARKGADRAKHAVAQNMEIIARVGTLEIQIDGRLQKLLELTETLARAQGIVIGRAEGKAQEQSDQIKRTQGI